MIGMMIGRHVILQQHTAMGFRDTQQPPLFSLSIDFRAGRSFSLRYVLRTTPNGVVTTRSFAGSSRTGIRFNYVLGIPDGFNIVVAPRAHNILTHYLGESRSRCTWSGRPCMT
jgi:hypothetical protein